MIKLIAVVAYGGVPAYMKSFVGSFSEDIIASMVEAIKAFSSVIGKSEVRSLDFGDDKLMFAETNKGYTLLMLVSGAEDYFSVLIRIIAEKIDADNEIPRVEGMITSDIADRLSRIVNQYIDSDFKVDFTEFALEVFSRIIDIIGNDSSQVKYTYKNSWSKVAKKVDNDLWSAIENALKGNFDYACALSIKLSDDISKILAVRTGLIASSMIRSFAPPLNVLYGISKSIKKDNEFTRLLRVSIEYRLGYASILDYYDAFDKAVRNFKFIDDTEHLVYSLLFVEETVGRYPKFAEQLAEYLKNKSRILYTYIKAVLDRTKIFSKLYSITKFDEFKRDLSYWKGKINEITREIDSILNTSFWKKLFRLTPRKEEINRIALINTLQMQIYIALLTAIAESPILPLREREEILREVYALYKRYVRKLIRSGIPLQLTPILNMFQSISVVLNELYYFWDKNRIDEFFGEIEQFLDDVLYVIRSERPLSSIDFSFLTVIMNAIFPILGMREAISEQEKEILRIAYRTLNIATASALKVARPHGYAVMFGNLSNALASVLTRLKHNVPKEAFEICYESMINIHKWFLAHGIVCRDDIATMTLNVSKLLTKLPKERIISIVDTIESLINIAILDPNKYDYEKVVFTEPQVNLYMQAYRITGKEKYKERIREILRRANQIWLKYGYKNHAEHTIKLLQQIDKLD